MSGSLCKVAVTGAHSTGKSTFVSRLQNELLERGVPAACVHTSASRARECGFPILRDHNFESTAWIIAETIKNEMLGALHSNVVLVDRPVLDALGYFVAALSSTGRIGDTIRRDRLDRLCASWVGEYDLIIVTEIDPSVGLGPDRDTDSEFRVAAGKAIKEVAERMTPNFLLLRRGQEEGVIELAVSHVVNRVCLP